MTVKELIDKLQQFDEDKLVLVEDPAGDVLKENDIKRFIKGLGFVLQWAKYGLKK